VISMPSIGSIIAAGACFMLANLAMKLLGDKPFFILYPVVATAIVAGCWFQVVAFREAQFGLAVVLILGLEMLFSILVARTFLGETYSSTNMVGVMLVIAGMGLVHMPAGAQSGPEKSQNVFHDAKVKKGPRPTPVEWADGADPR
jgi:multidrug transporter EmrE-like cation transporter